MAAYMRHYNEVRPEVRGKRRQNTQAWNRAMRRLRHRYKGVFLRYLEEEKERAAA